MNIKENNLTITHPDVAKEWDYQKNKEMLPEHFTQGNHQKVYWVCEKGHSFLQVIKNRTQLHQGCPYCANQKILCGFNDLATTHPKLTKEWHPIKNGDLKPTDVAAGSNKKVWWLGECGHEWEATILGRAKGHGCPYCSNRKVLAGYNDLTTTHPELAKEWHPTKNGDLKPTDVTAGSGKKIWWVCEKGHEWKAVISPRTKRIGCPICSHYKVLVGYNDLATTHPQLMKEWHPTKNGDLKPTDVTAGSGKRVWWQCVKCGHEWQTPVFKRSNGSGCPKENKARTTSFKEYAIDFCVGRYTEVIHSYKIGNMELDCFLPKYNIGIEYDGSYYHKNNDRDLKKNKYCKENGITLYRLREAPLTSLNDSSIDIECAPNIKSLSRALSILIKKIFGIEECIDISKDILNIENLREHHIRKNSLLEKFPQIATEWHTVKNGYLKPEHFSHGSNVKVWWKCKEGHEYMAKICDRIRGASCPYCLNKKVLVGYNDLTTTYPEIAKEWHPTKNGDLKPTDVVAGSQKNVWWFTEEEGEWQAIIHNRTKTKKSLLQV